MLPTSSKRVKLTVEIPNPKSKPSISTASSTKASNKVASKVTISVAAPKTNVRLGRVAGLNAFSACSGISEILKPISNKSGGLYISDFKNARTITKLKELGITHVLTLLPGTLIHFPEYAKQGITQVGIDAHDTFHFKLAPHFNQITQFITQGRDSGGVLVHCVKGISRSVSAVIIYLMLAEKLELKAALSLVKAKRPIARPNIGFMQQLQALDEKLQLERKVQKADESAQA